MGLVGWQSGTTGESSQLDLSAMLHTLSNNITMTVRINLGWNSTESLNQDIQVGIPRKFFYGSDLQIFPHSLVLVFFSWNDVEIERTFLSYRADYGL